MAAALAGFSLMLVTVHTASAVDVTYQVDMSEQIAQGNFNPANGDTVFVAGNFATTGGGTWLQTATDGSTNYILHPSGTNANLYIGTFNITNAVGTYENHQFVMNPGGNFGNLMWETAVGNRFFQVPATATNLPAVYWNDIAPGSTVVTPVTFRVDMSVQTTLGNFHPDQGDLVFVAGDWNWSATGTPMTQTATNADIWTATVDLTNVIGTTVNYKFLYIPFVGNTTWEKNDVGPGGIQNRQFAFPASVTNLPVVYFNNVTNTSSQISVPVTFQVNMAVQDALGTFDPGSDDVAVSGDASLNNWDPSVSPLTQTATNPDLYVGTYNVTAAVGAAVSYKFVVNGGVGGLAWEANNVGPGGAQDRQLVQTNVTATLAPVFWNNVNNLGSLSLSNSTGQAAVKWTAGPKIRLQSSTNLAQGWADVPETQGSNSATVNISGQTYFRLIGP